MWDIIIACVGLFMHATYYCHMRNQLRACDVYKLIQTPPAINRFPACNIDAVYEWRMWYVYELHMRYMVVSWWWWWCSGALV